MKRTLCKRGAALLALVLALALLAGCGGAAGETAMPPGALSGAELTIECFQAGAADAFLLTTENGAVLIDCGEKGFGSTILDALEARDMEKLDYLIITHFDQDHVGGAAKVLKNIAVDTVLQSNCPKDSDEYESYVKALGNAGLEAETVTKDRVFFLDGVRFTVEPPQKSTYEKDASNNSSLIVSVENGEHLLLFMGDAETERLEEFLARDPQPCDFLKVPHHGREDKRTEDLMQAVKPTYAVITSSLEEPEEEAVLAALAEVGAQVFLTRTAPVRVFTDGTTMTVEYER